MYKKMFNYLVYDDGRIYSLKLKRYLKQSTTQLGYKHVCLIDNDGVSKIWKVHRVVALMFCNPPKNWKSLQVNHKDGDKANNYYENLEWCDAWYNNYHARVTGLNNVVESNKKRWNDPSFRNRTSRKISESRLGKFTRQDNPEWRYDIRDKNGMPLTRKELAKLTGKALSTISRSIRECSQGKDIPYFKALGVSVTDRKKSQSTIERSFSEKNTKEQASRVAYG